MTNRPQQMAQLGLVIAQWAYVEQAMAFLYDYLLAQHGPPEEFGRPVDGLGVAAFGVVRATRTKLDLLHLAIEWRLGAEVLAEFVSDAGKKIELASKARNVLAHGLVEFSDSHPDALIIDWNGQEIIYRPADFAATTEKLRIAHEAVARFHNIRARQILQII